MTTHRSPSTRVAHPSHVLPTPAEMADWCHPRTPTRTFDLPGYLHQASDALSAAPPRRLLGVWAHPDDEAYLSAGLMATIIDAGGRVTVFALTDGEAGFGDDDMRPPYDRARLRRAELRSAMAAIGVTDVRFLGLPDGALADADVASVVGEIDAVIADVEPDVIVTFGPDGVTGHEDHVANSKLVTQAWLQRPCGELWYAAKTTEWLDTWRDLHDDFGVWMTDEPTGVRPEQIEFVVEMEGRELDRKRAVLAAHHSQTAGLSAAFGEDRYRRWINEEAFRRPTAAELTAPQRPPAQVLVSS